MYVLLTTAVRYNGARIAAGEIIELDEEHAKQLLNEGSAEGPLGAPEGVTVYNPDGDIKSTVTYQEGPPASEIAATSPEVTDPEVEKLKSTLDNQYKKDELVDAAFKTAVEFPAGATKSEIINAAVAQGKAVALLK